jgi:YHS domain-containing protein
MLRYSIASLVAAGLLSACATTPPGPVRGEFWNQCTTGLAMGQHIYTDCSINTKSPDGKTLCFGNQAAKDSYAKDPTGTLAKAKQFWNAGLVPEFGGMCTTGLAMGKKIPTDCSLSESAKGKAYCFGNKEARDMYLKDADGTVKKAQDFFAKG